MDLADSCTFKVFATCSYPQFTVNSTDVNVLVASFKGKDDKDAGNDDAANDTLKWAPKSDGKTIATVPDDMKSADCDSQKRMYLTLTRVQPQATKSATSRLLAASNPGYYQLTISGNSASFFKAGLILVLSAVFAIYAF